MRIYAACLASYNNGVLHGDWIDCANKDTDDLQAEVAAMLRASRFPNVMVEHEGQQVASAEEWAIHDSEDFEGMVSEYTPLAEVAKIAEALDGDNVRGFLWLRDHCRMDIEDAMQKADEVVIFESDRHDLCTAYAEEVVEELGDLANVPEWLRCHIDYEGVGRGMRLGGDIVEASDSEGAFLVTNASAF